MATKRALIYGANGSLGKNLVSLFRSNAWIVTALDFTSNPAATNNITLARSKTPKESLSSISTQLQQLLNNNQLDCIINVAGGWQGGSLESEIVDGWELMSEQSVISSLLSAKLALKFLKP